MFTVIVSLTRFSFVAPDDGGPGDACSLEASPGGTVGLSEADAGHRGVRGRDVVLPEQEAQGAPRAALRLQSVSSGEHDYSVLTH